MVYNKTKTALKKNKKSGAIVSVTALNVSNSILRCAFYIKIDITPMKLQKLLYYTYYQSKNIKDYYKDQSNDVWFVDEANSEAFKHALDFVWNNYSHYDGIELSNLTHQKRTAWYTTLSNDGIYIQDVDILNEGWTK